MTNMPHHLIFDGEIFGRKTIRVSSLDELKGEKLVPALGDYYQKITAGLRP